MSLLDAARDGGYSVSGTIRPQSCRSRSVGKSVGRRSQGPGATCPVPAPGGPRTAAHHCRAALCAHCRAALCAHCRAALYAHSTPGAPGPDIRGQHLSPSADRPVITGDYRGDKVTG